MTHHLFQDEWRSSALSLWKAKVVIARKLVLVLYQSWLKTKTRFGIFITHSKATCILEAVRKRRRQAVTPPNLNRDSHRSVYSIITHSESDF
jgi:hypothetical protein